MRTVLRVSSRNAAFQQWQALLTNRAKRHRSGEFLVQGVRPITMAVRHGWTVRALLYDADRQLSRWATDLLSDASDAAASAEGGTSAVVPRHAVSGELLAELADKDQTELVAVVATRPDDLERVPADATLVVVLDRPTSPGNLGTVIRCADAFGADAVVVCGHAADVYDPKTVRASTGSLFALPVVRAPSPAPVLARAAAIGLHLVGTDEGGDVDVDAHDLTRPTALLIGNETTGLSSGWRDACDRLVRIPIGGGASSLNAATAAGIALYEATRQRRRHGGAGTPWST